MNAAARWLAATPVIAVLAASATAGDPASLAATETPHDEADLERVYYDALEPDGSLRGGMMLVPRPDLSQIGLGPASGVSTIVNSGRSANRVDLVFVGDGYTASDLDDYAAHVANGVADLFSQQPFQTYRSYFNVHRVDVISAESGVDHDPVQGVLRDTALDMGFWCNGIERLLCVNVTAAWQQAWNAPDVEHVLAVANSNKYGGAGYTSSDLATFAGGNSAAPEVAIHELGHSFGNLADEYDYNDGAVYAGPERPERNISILDEAQMAATGVKWAAWLDDPGPGAGGHVGTYEGAYYHVHGIHRPTVNSKMRSLFQPFNGPSVEGLVIQLYQLVSPIDDATPDVRLYGSETLSVEVQQPLGHALEVQWKLDGVVLDDATGTSLDLAMLNLTAGAHNVTVTVTDPTGFVRDEEARRVFMSETRSWQVGVPPPGDIDGDFDVDTIDMQLLLAAYGTCGCPCSADLDGDCDVDVTDLLTLLANWT